MKEIRCKLCRERTKSKKKICWNCQSLFHTKEDRTPNSSFKKTLRWKDYVCLGKCHKPFYTNQYIRICTKCKKREGEGLPALAYKVSYR